MNIKSQYTKLLRHVDFKYIKALPYPKLRQHQDSSYDILVDVILYLSG